MTPLYAASDVTVMAIMRKTAVDHSGETFVGVPTTTRLARSAFISIVQIGQVAGGIVWWLLEKAGSILIPQTMAYRLVPRRVPRRRIALPNPEMAEKTTVRVTRGSMTSHDVSYSDAAGGCRQMGHEHRASNHVSIPPKPA